MTDRSLIPGFLAALRREMDLYRGWAASFDTLYIGGGTPSVLPAAELEKLIADIRAAFTISSDAEITVEANPADIDAESPRRAPLRRGEPPQHRRSILR